MAWDLYHINIRLTTIFGFSRAGSCRRIGLMEIKRPLEELVGRAVATSLAVVCLIVLLTGCYLVLRPFMNAVIWAAILCFTTWPVYRWLALRVHNRPTISATVMTLMVILAIMMPILLLGMSLAEDVGKMVRWVQSFVRTGAPEPPSWLTGIPWVGRIIEDFWRDLVQDSTKLPDLVEAFFRRSKGWFFARGRDLAASLFELISTLFITFFFYRDGERIVRRLNTVVKQVAGPHTQHLLTVVGSTARGVVYGVLGTALAQGSLATVGFWATGVPMAPLLGLTTFFLSLIPAGPPLVWIPASIWLLAQGAVARGIFMALWGLLVVSTVDNFIKPYLISRESNLPFALVFLGVMGGLVAFGPIGVFLGPILLAVGYALLKVWEGGEGEERV
jgi:predicted PurR-regulated permease PerM